MYSQNVLNGTNCERVQTEASAWLKVMDELASLTGDLSRDRRAEARRLIREGKAALAVCLAKRIVLTSPRVKKAQQLVNSVLAIFPQWSKLVDCVFFLAVSTSSLDALVTRAEAMGSSGLSNVQRRRIKQALDSVVDALDAKLGAWQKELE